MESSFAQRCTKPFGAGLLLMLAVSLTTPGVVYAHGDPPEGLEIFSVDDGWVYVTNFGVITSDFPTRYVCEEAFFASETFVVAPTDTSRWATFSRSLASVTDDGCDFEVSQPIDDAPTSMAIDPGTGQAAFAVRNDGQNQLWHSDDGGATWTQIDVAIDDLHPTHLAILEPGEVTILGYETDEESRGTAILVEIDATDGQRRDIELDRQLTYPQLLDARAGDLLWHARRDGITEVFWSQGDDLEAGHFEAPGWPVSGALSEDGSRAYLGGIDGNSRGVFEARRDDPSVWEEIITDHRALCMAADGDDLLVCGHRRDDDHDLARWNLDQGLQKVVDFRDLEGIVDHCGEDSRALRTCPPVWPELARALGIDVEPGDEDPSDVEEEDEEGDSRCAAVATGPPAPLLILFALLLAVRRSYGRR